MLVIAGVSKPRFAPPALLYFFMWGLYRCDGGIYGRSVATPPPPP